MPTRRGFIGALFGGAAATTGGVLIPKAIAAREKIEVTATPEMMKSLQNAKDDGIVVYNAESIPKDFFAVRADLYQLWWIQASPELWHMSNEKYEAFIQAHVKVNVDFGILADTTEGPQVEGDVGMKTPFPHLYSSNEQS
jgi:hypothetical protein